MRPLFLLLLSSLLPTIWIVDATPVFGGERFPVYWNFPWDACKKKHSIPVAKFKIIHNTDFTFMGDRVNTFYEYDNGLFPYFEKYRPHEPVNGGLPQNLNLAAHLSTLEGHVLTHIKDANYSGPAMLDVEEWRPMYHMNWEKKDVYQTESIKLVKKRFPSISDKGAKEAATKEFNAAAKKILVTSFRLVKRLRPHAKWGLYGFPLQDFHAGEDATDMHVGTNFMAHNDNLRWLYDELTLITPSIYLGEASARRMWHPDSAAANYRYVHAHLLEAQRIANWYSPPKPIMPYTKFEYNPYENDMSQLKYYSKIDACNTLKLAADFGAEGALIWSGDKNLAKRCEKIIKAFTEDYGPTVVEVRDSVGRCAAERCSGNGNCVNKLRSQTQACKFEMPLAEYECACDVGYHGDKCELVDEKKEEL